MFTTFTPLTKVLQAFKRVLTKNNTDHWRDLKKVSTMCIIGYQKSTKKRKLLLNNLKLRTTEFHQFDWSKTKENYIQSNWSVYKTMTKADGQLKTFYEEQHFYNWHTTIKISLNWKNEMNLKLFVSYSLKLVKNVTNNFFCSTQLEKSIWLNWIEWN